MSRWEYFLFHMANGLVIGTGLVYAWMLYVMRPMDEFAVVNHPFQPYFLHGHVVAAPLLVLCLGHFGMRHAYVFWSNGTQEGRKTGLGLFLLGLPMVMSGYFLQVSVHPDWRTVWLIVHLSTSAGWIGACGLHVAIHVLARRKVVAST